MELLLYCRDALRDANASIRDVCRATAVGSVGDRYHDASDGISALLGHKLSRVYGTPHRRADAGRQGLPAAAGLHRSDGYHMGHRPSRFQPLHRRLPTIQSGSSLHCRAGLMLVTMSIILELF